MNCVQFAVVTVAAALPSVLVAWMTATRKLFGRSRLQDGQPNASLLRWRSHSPRRSGRMLELPCLSYLGNFAQTRAIISIYAEFGLRIRRRPCSWLECAHPVQPTPRSSRTLSSSRGSAPGAPATNSSERKGPRLDVSPTSPAVIAAREAFSASVDRPRGQEIVIPGIADHENVCYGRRHSPPNRSHWEP